VDDLDSGYVRALLHEHLTYLDERLVALPVGVAGDEDAAVAVLLPRLVGFALLGDERGEEGAGVIKDRRERVGVDLEELPRAAAVRPV
jgi:hypothetical protein